MDLSVRERAYIAVIGLLFMVIAGPLVTGLHYISIVEKDQIDLYNIYVIIPVTFIGLIFIGLLWFMNERN